MPKKSVFAALVFLLLACNNESETQANTAPESDVDAARTFIRYALDGKWKDARGLIVQDSANLIDLELAEQNYTQRMSVIAQRGYRESTIRIFDTKKLGDSASVVTYANTYMNKKDSIKVVRQNDRWLVDLKYSFMARNPVAP